MGEKLLKSSVNYLAEFDKMRKEDLFVDCSLAAEGRYLRAHKALLCAASAYFEVLFTQENERNPVIIFTNISYNQLEAALRLIYQGKVEVCEDGLAEFLNVVSFLQIDGIDHNKLVVRQTNVTTCDNDINETTSIPEAFFVRVKMEDEDSVSDIEEYSDNEHVAHNYLSREESSPIMSSSDFGPNESFVRTCEENVLKSDLRDIESNLPCSSGEYECSTLETDIDIKEEEICSDMKIECDDVTVRMEDECCSEDVNAYKEVSPGQPDTNTPIEDAAVQCGSAVSLIGNEERFKCTSCDFETSHAAVFIVHKCSDILERPFQLSHCASSSVQSSPTVNIEMNALKGTPFKSSRSTALDQKLASTMYVQKEGGKNTMQSLQCTYASTGKKDVVNHLCSNTVEKPFKCSQCSYACCWKGNLNCHMRTHTGEKPYKCSQCTFACSRKGNLDNHMRTHTGEKPYKCSQCSYACSQQVNLKIHMRTHTGEKPVKCSQCTYACSQKSNLIRHMRTHTGEKPFKCSQCTYACSVSGSLKTHMLTHSGEKPFKCSQCTFAFNHKGDLIEHMRTHVIMPSFKRNF